MKDTNVPVESECCDGECNHDDCCGKVEANCTHKKSVPVEKLEEIDKILNYWWCQNLGKSVEINGYGDFYRALAFKFSDLIQAAVEEERHRISELLTVNLETSKMLDGWEKYWVEVEGGRFIERCIECENDKRIRYAIINKHQ